MTTKRENKAEHGGHTLLIGNGINRIHSRLSWDQLLREAGGQVPREEKNRPPNTFIYEGAVMDCLEDSGSILVSEGAVKESIAEKMREMPTHNLYRQLFALGLKDYVTTNYDYAFKRTILGGNDAYSEEIHRPEVLYSLRRRTEIYEGGDFRCRIWNMHGEIDQPRSIMLGLGHYGDSMERIGAYVKGNYKLKQEWKENRLNSMLDKLKNKNEWDGLSWVELFFMNHVHIVGFSMDYSEIDLWWILNKRARIMKAPEKGLSLNNEVTYYTTEIDSPKRHLLEAMNVEVVEAPKPTSKGEWEQYYRGVIKQIAHKTR